MAIRIKFDATHNPEQPTIILAKKSGEMLGMLNARHIEVSESLNAAPEITFNVYKHLDGKKDYLWDQITNFKLVYCVEWDAWFEIVVELDESNEVMKTVFCTGLGEAELGQIMLYDIEINTEIDISREDYDEDYPTVLYRSDMPEASLLHRIMEKAPHYDIAYVDDSIKNLQRTFTFDDTSLYDAFREISEEINCLFKFEARLDDYIDDNGKRKTSLRRLIYVYDLESNCTNPHCKYRGDFTGICPECDNTDGENVYEVDEGYGNDTTIFITPDELAEDIQLTYDTDATKNCFRLEAGDDLMTATIRSCNPNGSNYIWHIPDTMKMDMSEALVYKLDSYDDMYDSYQTSVIEINEDAVKSYNDLVDIYDDYNSELQRIVLAEDTIVDTGDNGEEIRYVINGFQGYPSLIDAYYNTVDLYLYLQSGLMPSVNTSKPSLEDVMSKLTAANLSPVATSISSNDTEGAVGRALKALHSSTVDNIVLSMAKTLVDSRYKIKVIGESTLSEYVEGSDYRTWVGRLSVTSYSDDTITAETDDIIVEVNAEYETFVRQKLDKALSNENTEDVSISNLFKKTYYTNKKNAIYNGDTLVEEAVSCDRICSGCARANDCFRQELKEYSLNRLSSFYDACQTCVDILIEQGVADDDHYLYEIMYVPYCNKLTSIAEEMGIRQSEIESITGVYDSDGDLVMYGLQNYIEDAKENIQKSLNFEAYINSDIELNGIEYAGRDLWNEFCSFRREDKYSNDHYVSDGLNNAELIDAAKEFIDVAQKEIFKSAELQRSISASLHNLLSIRKFEPIVDMFEVGNFLRVIIDDEVYKLRLIKYEIDYDEIDGITVEFSDVVNAGSSVKTIQDIMNQSSSMATSYPSVKRQASDGRDSKSQLTDWVNNGLALTKMKIVDDADNQNVTWDSHGILCKEYLPMTDTYDDRQLKIINRGLYVTNDNWKTSKAGIGSFLFYNPKSGQTEEGYGVIADTLVGSMILSEDVGIYTENGNITLNENGVVITVDKDADDKQDAFTIQSVKGGKTTELLNVDADGNLVINGAASITTAGKGYEFSDFGLFITDASGSNLKNQLTEDGMVIYRGDTEVLKANNDGVKAEDLHATTYLIIGENSRFEDYEKNGKKHTGCFWIG